MLSQTIIFFTILLLFIIWLFNRQRIRYWVELLQERGLKSTFHYDRCLKVFNKLYENENPTSISIKERKEKNLEDVSYIYGEVLFFSFVRMLEHAQPKPGEVFYDLGSGGGKAVFIAALVFNFSKACGIEKLASLSDFSNQQLRKLEAMKEFHELLPGKQLNISFRNEDFLIADFSDADILFISATCFRGEIFTSIVKKLMQLKVGARVILSSASFSDIGGFELKYTYTHLMSWGLSEVRIYERV